MIRDLRKFPRLLWSMHLLPAGICVMALAGCRLYQASTPRVPVLLPGEFSDTGRAETPDQWWKSLNDPKLNRLVEAALARNQNLLASWDRLRRAGADANLAGAGLFPEVTGTASGKRSLTQSANSGSTAAGSGVSSGSSTENAPRSRSLINTYTLGLAASYELDLWGRVRTGRKAAVLTTAAAEEDLRAASISLSAEVANAWYGLLERRGQIALLQEQIKTNNDFLTAVRQRFNRGQVTAVDVFQQEQILESTRGELAQARSRLRVQEHRLAVLLGMAPGMLNLPLGDKLPAIPPLPLTGVPLATLQKRPDVHAAFLRVRAADRRLGAAIADYFPRISLKADSSTSSARVNEFFSNWVANLAGNLLAPLIDGGRRRAVVRKNRAIVSEQLHLYGKSLLGAVEEVENALAREVGQRDYLASLERQLELARKASGRSLQEYRNGAMDFTRLLTTLQSMQRLERTVLQARLDLLLVRISLYRALAGGWELQAPAGHRTNGNPCRPAGPATGRAPRTPSPVAATALPCTETIPGDEYDTP